MGEITVPVFPLPNAVLLPGVIMPLHIFEPRYKRMIEDIRVQGGQMVVAWQRPEPEGLLAPCETACLGSVDVRREYPDGRKDILVTGQSRVRILRYGQEVPYRVASCGILSMAAMAPEDYQRRLAELKEIFARWVFIGFDDAARVIHHVHPVQDLDALCNFIVHYFIPDFSRKQGYLEMGDLNEKSLNLLQFVVDNVRSLEHHINLLRAPGEDDKTVH